MAYDGRVLRRARDQFEADRAEREARFQARREEIFRRKPRLREVEEALRSTTPRILSAALRRGADPLPALASLREENLALQREREQLLRDLGLPQNALDDPPACPLCGGSGYRDGVLCGGKGCLRSYYAREQQRDLSRMLDLGSQSFSAFSLDYYPDAIDPAWGMSARENMEQVYQVCVNFARHFRPGGGNLLLFGPPGLGKTFLSAAMAREISAAGYSVFYDTAGHIFEAFEKRKFDREDEDDVERVIQCDLLILDDLGTEMTTAFVQSALYQIVNTRLLERRSTVLNTNMGPGGIAKRYSPQIASRLEGEYQFLAFFGEDIRKLKRRRGQH